MADMTTPGTLVLMGSGETTPTMVTTHQRLFATTAERAGTPVDAALLDTPYGFQENAQEISDKARHYFSHHVGAGVDLLTARRPAEADGATRERVLDRIRGLGWLFAGPGSPTYAASQWNSAPFAEAMADVVARGGTLVLASAAAVTAGRRTIPVYEVYKAGATPSWQPGLGVVEAITGWRCVVVPHYDNAEGGTHDTRFCYLGARRLAVLEAELDPDEWVLGVDEHTAAVIDLAAGRLRVEGRGGVHVRRGGRQVASFPSGSDVPLAALLEDHDPGQVPGEAADGGGGAGAGAGAASPGGGAGTTPMLEAVGRLSARFDQALADKDADTALAATLELEETIRAWAADTEQSDEHERAVTQLRRMITRLGVLAGEGMHDHIDLVRPHIETLLHVREDARARRAFEVADHIRGHMDADGVVVRDTREGTEWEWQEPATSE